MWQVDYDVRIFTSELSDSLGKIIPRLQPLDGDTVLQIFGNESSTYKMKAKVVGYTDIDTLKGYTHDGSLHTFSEVGSGAATSGYYSKQVYIQSMNYNRNKTTTQTLRLDLDCYTPVFDVEFTLFENDN